MHINSYEMDKWADTDRGEVCPSCLASAAEDIYKWEGLTRPL